MSQRSRSDPWFKGLPPGLIDADEEDKPKSIEEELIKMTARDLVQLHGQQLMKSMNKSFQQRYSDPAKDDHIVKGRLADSLETIFSLVENKCPLCKCLLRSSLLPTRYSLKGDRLEIVCSLCGHVMFFDIPT